MISKKGRTLGGVLGVSTTSQESIIGFLVQKLFDFRVLEDSRYRPCPIFERWISIDFCKGCIGNAEAA